MRVDAKKAFKRAARLIEKRGWTNKGWGSDGPVCIMHACIYARKSEIRLIATHDPERIDLIRMLEDKVADKAAARAEANGTTLAELGYDKPAWFQAPMGGGGECWPIDKVVKWSKTARGGRQYELFAPAGEEGCMRWGLCETGARDSEEP